MNKLTDDQKTEAAKSLLSFLPFVLKTDRALLVYAAAVVIGLGALVAFGKLDMGNALLLLGVALGSPGLLGRKQDDHGTPPTDGTTAAPPAPTSTAPTLPRLPPDPPSAARAPLQSGTFRALLVACVFAVALLLAGCGLLTPQQTKDAKDVTRTTLTIVQHACVVANFLFPTKDIQEFCHLSDEFIPLIEPIVSAQKAAGGARCGEVGVAKPVPMACVDDGDGHVRCSPTSTTDGGR